MRKEGRAFYWEDLDGQGLSICISHMAALARRRGWMSPKRVLSRKGRQLVDRVPPSVAGRYAHVA